MPEPKTTKPARRAPKRATQPGGRFPDESQLAPHHPPNPPLKPIPALDPPAHEPSPPLHPKPWTWDVDKKRMLIIDIDPRIELTADAMKRIDRQVRQIVFAELAELELDGDLVIRSPADTLGLEITSY